MANNYRIAGSSNWTDIAYWSLGAAPIAADTPFFRVGADTLDTNLPGLAAGINYAGLIVKESFEGRIGTSSNKLYVGSIPTVNFNGERCQECFLCVDTADTITSFLVKSTGTLADALNLNGPGTITNLRLYGSRSLVTGNTLVLTNLYATPTTGAPALARIGAGTTLANAYIDGGYIKNYVAIGTLLQLTDGTWEHTGTSAINIATVNQWGGTMRLWAQGGTTTTYNLYGGTLDCNGGDGTPRTITTLNQEGGHVNLSGLGSTMVINTWNRNAGTYSYDP